MLMGMGSLATIGARQPENLAIVVIDNEAFGETGGQPSHTGLSTNLAAVALACGFRKVMTVRNASELDDVRALVMEEKGPVLAVLKTSAKDLPRVLPERDGHAIRNRFKKAIAT
jgi:thiamine pyrophosphate-dependent acetolactate synthase large subunit-like protein